MNHIFKVVKNHKGNQVVVSELARGAKKGKTIALMLFSTLIAGTAFATPISIQGTATSENAVSVGTDSFATAVNSVANGKGTVATGQGFNREEFAGKVAENKAALDAVNNKQNEINNKGNELIAANDAIGQLNTQIDELNRKQVEIAGKIHQKNELNSQKDALTPQLNQAQNELVQAERDLAGLRDSQGKNLYLNFTDILKTLNWNPIDGTDQKRNIVANELKQRIENSFSDFANRYTDKQYQNIVQGYLNRQASYQGTLEYLLQNTSYHDVGVIADHSLDQNKILYQDNYFNTPLDDNSYNFNENKSAFALFDSDIISSNALRAVNKDVGNYQGEKIVNAVYSENNRFFFGNYINKDGKLIERNRVYYVNNIKDYKENDKQSVYNALLLLKNSLKKSETNNTFNALMTRNEIDYDLSHDNKYGRNTTGIALLEDIGLDGFAQKYNERVLKNYHNGVVLWGLKTLDGKKVYANGYGAVNQELYDKNIGVLTKLRDYSVDNNNLISTQDITHFKQFLQKLKDNRNNIDWNFNESAVNLNDYQAKYDKVVAYNEEINEVLDLYQDIINERKKSNANLAVIDEKTKQLMDKKEKVLAKTEDLSNFIQGIELTFNEQFVDKYINYAKDETDFMIGRINNELKLYDDKDTLIVEATNKAKELQKAYDDAKVNRDEKQAELDRINKQIDDLALTPSEEATDDVKSQKEEEKAAREADKTRLEDEIRQGNEELERLKSELANTSLKDLGLRSQAYGSQAFASGNDSIAIGTNSTVTANDGIALGQNATVTGIESIAIGKDSKVSGTKSIAIGVGHTVSGNRSTTIGDPNTVSGNDAFVAGNNNNVQSNNVMVLGNNVTVAAGFDNAVILGESSAPSQANPTSNIQIRGETFNFSGTSPSSTVSIGSAGKERQITHVAAGRLSDSSTDAINGSQLYAVVAALNKIETDLVTPTDVSDTVGQALKDKLKAGDNITIDETESPDDGTKTYTINAKQPDIQAGNNVSVNKQGDTVTISANLPNIEGGDGVTVNKVGDTITINAEGKTYTAGDNVSITADHKINANGTTVSGNTDVVIKTTTEAGANGATNTNYEVTISDALKEKINKEESVTAGGNNLSVTQNDTNDTGGKNFVVDLSKDLDLTAGGSLKIGDINLAAGNVNMGGNVISGVAEGKAPTDAVNVSQLQKAKTGIKAGDKVKVSPEEQQDGSTVYTVNALTTEVKAGTNAKITKEAGDQGQDVYNVEVTGDLTDINSLTNGDTTLTLGNNNVNVGGAAIGGVAKATKDDEAVNLAQLKAAKTGIEAGKKVTVTPVDQPDGTTKFTVNAHTSEVTNGKNTTVTKDVGTEGQDIFKVNVEGDLTNITSIANGDTKLSIGDGVINAGGSTLSNIAEGKAPTDAVNVSQLNAAKSSVKAGDKVKVTHEKQDDGSTVYTVNALTSHVTGGKNVVVDKTTGENGEDKFTVNLASDLTDINSIKKGDTGFTFGDNNIDVGGATLSNIGTPVNDNDAATKSYVDNSRTSVTSTDATVRVVKTVVNAMTGAVNYDLSVTAKAPEFTFGVGTKDEIKFKDGGHLNIVGGSDAIETKVDGNTIKVDLSEAGKATLAKVNNGIHSQTDDGKTLNYQLGDTIKVTGDGKNLTTTTTAEGKVSVRLKDNVKVNSVTTGNVSISTQGINAGGNKVVNVANGHISPTSKDAINGSQLYATNIQVNQNTQNIANLGERVNHLDNKINRLRKENRAGIAGAAAIAGLPEIHLAGKSMVSAAAGTYRGENAIAIGYSRLSDNSKVKIKLSGSASTRGDFIGTVGVGYAW